jgi:hypothetical protein
MSLTPGHVRWSGHRIGQDTRAVLCRIAGLSEAEIDALENEGVVSGDQRAEQAPVPTKLDDQQKGKESSAGGGATSS